ncbi:MAG: hypothetical protein IPK03_17580 [Bacteroidetes bacterium]|nr:hypothetical protein [Bacteroidota bacterium]
MKKKSFFIFFDIFNALDAQNLLILKSITKNNDTINSNLKSKQLGCGQMKLILAV